MDGIKISAILTMLAVLIAVSGCTTSGNTASPTASATEKPTATPGAATMALSITGNVNNPLSLTIADLNKYPTKYVSASWNTTKKGIITANATGALLNKVLDAAGPRSDAANVTFKSPDGTSKAVQLSAIRESPDAIIGFMDNGTLMDIIPGQPAGTWISNLVTIEVQ